MSTRLQILSMYDVERTLIRSPGKFEGEALYVPYYWEIFLDGGADIDDGNYLKFKVTPDDKAQFPELKHRHWITLYEDSNGFVREV